MHDLWLVARHEYRHRAGKRSFLLATLSVPVLAVALIAAIILISRSETTTIGYVAPSGVLNAGVLPDAGGEESRYKVRQFPDAATARASLEKREIAAFYVLDQDYPRTRAAEMYFWDTPPDGSAQSYFSQFIRANLVAGLPDAAGRRLVEGPQVTVRSLDGTRSIGAGQWLALVLPFVVGLLFVLAVMMSAGQMLEVVADEKDNRTVEMLVTSISPEQLIGGKALGLMAVALTQIAVWFLAVVLLVVVGGQFMEALRGGQVPWDTVLVVILFFLPAFGLTGGIMTAIGAAVTEVRQGQQIAGVINLLFMLPLFLSALVFTDPNSPLMVALTLFPTTAFVAVSLRWGLAAVPFWQLGLSWLLLSGSALLSIWAAARIFRRGMLQYGQPLSVSGALAALGRRAR